MESTIRAYQKVLSGFRFIEAASFSERFAQARFAKKFQEPDQGRDKLLETQCWDEWISNDRDLPTIRNRLLPGPWYQARLLLHKWLEKAEYGSFRFPRGSSFTPTWSRNSLESRLCEQQWDCTPENFDGFASLCYGCAGLKRAARVRYLRWHRSRFPGLDTRQTDSFLWTQFKHLNYGPYEIFKWKLRQVVVFQHGARFSTVPKNNEKRRPINVECFANVLTQSHIGELIRSSLLRQGVDLRYLQERHRALVATQVATIDLKNASDSISVELVEFLLPKWLYRAISDARSHMVLGLDLNYHVTRKISSMGNGFTFELMTLILTALVKTIDPNGSVYGDDIIVAQDKAGLVISLLESVGLKVNRDKTFIEGSFRESCGANYHDSEGYVRSFDFTWPETPHDCVMLANKASYLGNYYPSFKRLSVALKRVTPEAWQGECPGFLDEHPVRMLKDRDPDASEDSLVFPPYVVSKRGCNQHLTEKERNGLIELCYEPSDFRVTYGWAFEPALRSSTWKDMRSWHWAKYLAYLHAGRRAPDTITGKGRWVHIRILTSSTGAIRSRALKKFPSHR